MCSGKFSLSSVKTSRYLTLITALIDGAAQLRFISIVEEWSFGFNVIAVDLAPFNVSLLATMQLLTFASTELRQYSNSFEVSALTNRGGVLEDVLEDTF